MNVASRGFRYFIILTTIFITHISQAMIMDSRYFPWLEQLYTNSDHNHSRLIGDGFLIFGGSAFRKELRATPEEMIISLPELYGELKLAEVAKSLVAAGYENPIPEDWRWLADCTAVMPGSMQGQGFDIQGYWSLSPWFGIGASTLIMRLDSLVHVLPSDDTIRKLYLDAPGNREQFNDMMDRFYNNLGMQSLISQEVGAGDTVVYGAFYGIKEYAYKMRKIDWSLWLGAIVPTGVKQNPYNLASVPFGGNGLWGLFFAPTIELELKDDLKVGAQFRLTKRLSRDVSFRLPLGEEQPLFGPAVGCAYVQSGFSVTGSAYVAFEDLRAGFGIEGKYTATYHQQDVYSSNQLVNGLKPSFSEVNCHSGFISEYATVKLFYDIAHDKDWKYRPLAYASWDIPRNHIGGKAFAKTNRVLIGCTINF